MKKYILWLIPFLLTASLSFAQNSILAGKILDENNNPVKGAQLKIELSTGSSYKAISDSDGLYYSQPVPGGKYSVSITSKNKQYKIDELYLPPMEQFRLFYDLTLKGDKADVRIHKDDPFMKAKISRIQHEKNRMDYPADGYRMDKDGIPHQTFYRTTIDSGSNKKGK